MGDLIEEIDKYLGCIPDDLLDNPNQMIQLIVDAKARIGELEKAVIIAYECGHNDTVESNYCDPEERAKEIIEENLTI